MKESRIDLHCHSTHSDGSMSPIELVLHAKELDLTGLAITDHDSITSYEAARATAKEVGIKLLPGVELSTTFGTEQVHVLGYAYDPASQAIKEFCIRCREHRLLRNRQILEKLCAAGMALEEADVVAVSADTVAYGRPHIALAMMKKGYVRTVQEAFWRYLGEGKSCYVPGEKYRVEDAIDVIHEAQGKAVIAHPHLIGKKAVIEALLALCFDGLEAFYGDFPEWMDAKWVEAAARHRFFVTGGSDFHGSVKPEIKLGVKLTSEPVFLELWNHFQSHNI